MVTPNRLRQITFGFLAVLLFVVALGAIAFGRGLVVPFAGVLAAAGGAQAAQRARGLPASAWRPYPQNALALKRWHWLVGLTLTIAAAAAFVWLEHDAATGGKSVAPLYVFAAAALLGGLWWVGLLVRWLR